MHEILKFDEVLLAIADYVDHFEVSSENGVPWPVSRLKSTPGVA